jgi:hypothetical protein
MRTKYAITLEMVVCLGVTILLGAYATLGTPGLIVWISEPSTLLLIDGVVMIAVLNLILLPLFIPFGAMVSIGRKDLAALQLWSGGTIVAMTGNIAIRVVVSNI